MISKYRCCQRSSWGYGSKLCKSDKPKENFLVISGDDMIALPMVLAGGAGSYPL
jgi:dihydrodipicolinate synthase/N-acetylneuraminate lyase